MKRIILDLAVSLDGFIEGINGEVDWCIMDDDMNFNGFLSGIDTIFYGRVSYELWGNYQPGPNSDKAESELWSVIHSKKKYVFSGKPDHRYEGSATFITSEIEKNVAEIQQQEGKDIWLYGGSNLLRSFIKFGLIDIYRISVHPTVLGKGKPLFQDIKERINLQLKGLNRFRSGVVQLIYENKK